MCDLQTTYDNQNKTTPCDISYSSGTKGWDRNSMCSSTQLTESMFSIDYIGDEEDDELERIFSQSTPSSDNDPNSNQMFVSSTESSETSQFKCLRKDYDTAVECLMHCESIINELQSQLKAKDNIIASLEGKLVKMSLDLASSKAFEDEHKAKRRELRSVNFTDENDSDLMPSRRDDQSTKSPMRADKNKRVRSRRASLFTGAEPSARAMDGNIPLRKSWWGGRKDTRGLNRAHGSPIIPDAVTGPHEVDDSYRTTHDSIAGMDESTTSRPSLNIGALFGKSRNNRHTEKVKQCRIRNEKELRQQDTHSRRGAPNRNRRGLTKSSSSCVSNFEETSVIFPTSFESVIIRGGIDIDLGCSFKNDSLKGLSKEDR